MQLKNIIGFELSAESTDTLQAWNPAADEILEGSFSAATENEADRVMQKAQDAFLQYRHFSGAKRGEFLRKIADNIEGLGDTLVSRVMQESGLPEGRVKGERGRTCGQLRLFAQVAEEGSWVDATIDTASGDIRRLLIPVGPVVVFTASNFPLAFSTAGGDTAAALASGCPVIVKAHESHLGTNAMVSEAIINAAKETGMPDGVFSSLNSKGYQIGQLLVMHSLTKSVAFTGSHRGGMALYKLAQQREEPIPVFAEMGSINPVFLLPQAIKNRSGEIASQLAKSLNMGAGQFCTNPGLLVIKEDDQTANFIQHLREAVGQLKPYTMLNKGIFNNYNDKKTSAINAEGVQQEQAIKEGGTHQALPAIASVSAAAFVKNPALHEEVFGPFSLLVKCKSDEDLAAVANSVTGQLTSTLMGEPGELNTYKNLIHILQEKAGRLIFNDVPTGVAVCHAMHHGGPYPATSDGRFTSVGTAAIKRFARPLCYQNFPDEQLPDALKAANPLGISRIVDGKNE